MNQTDGNGVKYTAKSFVDLVSKAKGKKDIPLMFYDKAGNKCVIGVVNNFEVDLNNSEIVAQCIIYHGGSSEEVEFDDGIVYEFNNITAFGFSEE